MELIVLLNCTELANCFVVKQLYRGSTSLQIIVLKFAQVHIIRGWKRNGTARSTRQQDKYGRDNFADDDTNSRYAARSGVIVGVFPREQRICEADDSSRHTYRRPT